MEKISVYNQEGKEVSKVSLPEDIFNVAMNADLLHQVVISLQANMRTPVAHTKDRGDVRGGGRKPWRQKGTGRARHGSIRSPLWRGGGVTFGPRNDTDYSKKVNKKMRTKALFVALSQKLRDGEMLLLDSVSFSTPKTADAKTLLMTLSSVSGFETLVTKKNNSALIVIPERDLVTMRSFNNIGNVTIAELRNINARDILMYKHVIFVNPEAMTSFFETKGKAKEGEDAVEPAAEKQTKKVVKKEAAQAVSEAKAK